MSRRVDATDPQFIRKLDYIPPHSVFLEAEKGLPAVAQTETDAEGHSIALTEAFYAHPIRQFSVIAAVTTYSTVAYRGADQPLDADLVEDDHRQQKDRVWTASEVKARLDDLGAESAWPQLEGTTA